MLITVTIENWMSFRDSVTFSMIASKERQHNKRLPRVRKYNLKLLPITLIYGGNASGKTNFFRALRFAKLFVVNGTGIDSLIPVKAFRLDNQSLKKPTRFHFEILVKNTLYDFSFSLTTAEVLEEKLIVVKSNDEKILYHRSDRRLMEIDPSLGDKQFLEFVFKGTRNNQLFLTGAISQNINKLRPVYDWFKDNLELLDPNTYFKAFEQLFDEKNPLCISMNEVLSQLDTGISRLGSERVFLEVSDESKPLFLDKLGEDQGIRFYDNDSKSRIVVTRNDEDLIAKRPVTFHPKSDGTEVKFEILEESDGSQRLLDLLPAFLNLREEKTYVIDEVDRSLHTLLVRSLLKLYLNRCSPNSRNQLLLTTHDVLLMDKNFLRRDEMWIAERDKTGASALIALSDYKDSAKDKDIRTSYLKGKFGGIPQIIMENILQALPIVCGEENNELE